MNYASSCIRTLDYLLRKHDRMLRQSARQAAALGPRIDVDRPPQVLITVEEHDRIYRMPAEGRSLKQIAQACGRSPTVIKTIRSGKHPLFDAARLG